MIAHIHTVSTTLQYPGVERSVTLRDRFNIRNRRTKLGQVTNWDGAVVVVDFAKLLPEPVRANDHRGDACLLKFFDAIDDLSTKPKVETVSTGGDSQSDTDGGSGSWAGGN